MTEYLNSDKFIDKETAGNLQYKLKQFLNFL